MDNLSNRRVRKNGREGRIFNCLSVGVSWDNGSQTRERLDSLEFIDVPIKTGHGLKPITERPKPKPRPKPYKH